MANHPKPPQPTRADKVRTALQGDDEFSVFSVDPEYRKPMMDLGFKDTEKAVATPLSRSIVRLFRKIFGD